MLTAPHLNAARRLENGLQSLPGSNVFAGGAGATTGRSRTGASPRTSPLFFGAASARGGSFDAARVAASSARLRVRVPTPRSIPRRAKPQVFADFGFGAPVDGFATKDDRPGAQQAKFEAFVGGGGTPRLRGVAAAGPGRRSRSPRRHLRRGGDHQFRDSTRVGVRRHPRRHRVRRGGWIHVDAPRVRVLGAVRLQIALSFRRRFLSPRRPRRQASAYSNSYRSS